MYVKPIEKKLLIHTVEWFPSKINGFDTKGYILKNVRVDANWAYYSDSNTIYEKQGSNFRMFWDAHWSTPLPEGKFFAIGDIIKMNQYPYTLTIRNVMPCWTEGTDKIHHYELQLD